VEEILYPAMEDFKLDLIIGRAKRQDHQAGPCSFTLVGATTRMPVTNPLRDGSIIFHLDFYSTDELKRSSEIRLNP